MECKNCGFEFEGNFCPNCGQRPNSGRIVLRDSLRDIADHWIGIDNPFFRTMKELLVRPGKMIKDYIGGKRKSYTQPFRYFIFILAFYLIFRQLIGFDPIEAFSEMLGAQEMPDPNTATTRGSNYFSKHINTFMIVFAFTLAGFAKLLNMRKPMYFVEYLTASFFLIGQYIVFSILVILLTQLHPILYLLNYIIVLVYPTIVFTQIQEGKLFARILKSIFITIFGWFIYAMIGFSVSTFIVETFNV
jgi:hypothetical protein